MYFGRDKMTKNVLGRTKFFTKRLSKFEDRLIIFCDNSFQVEVLQIVKRKMNVQNSTESKMIRIM